MKFSLAINLERMDPSDDIAAAAHHTTEMVQMAEAAGFEIAWAAEHHAIEMTIAPSPFQLLAWWGAHTSRIRLGTAVAVAAYWHPIRLAGESALLDVLSGGRLELGLGRGAYQREFDRMVPGLEPITGSAALRELLPAVRALWTGDYAHDGERWSFPTSTACPKPLQDLPPIWVAARDPDTYDWAVANGCNIMCWPLMRPMSELAAYAGRMDDAVAKAGLDARPRMTAMRYTAVWADDRDADLYIRSVQRQAGQFENLFKQLGSVTNGFAEEVDLNSLAHRDEYRPETLRENLMFGTPEQVVAKLREYEALGTDFLYCASYGAPIEAQKRSLQLFIDEVMPAFA
ncbi:MAG TPA: LLM class flavin-dependent oxidoreductase [Ilumatobacteraceae bacterium]|nr:LLM class flavin-dependent oxidoreductase [Ilumatobacteraceae bacterium]